PSRRTRSRQHPPHRNLPPLLPRQRRTKQPRLRTNRPTHPRPHPPLRSHQRNRLHRQRFPAWRLATSSRTLARMKRSLAAALCLATFSLVSAPLAANEPAPHFSHTAFEAPEPERRAEAKRILAAERIGLRELLAVADLMAPSLQAARRRV